MELTEKVDVIINVYGKPWQTLCTLKSLMLHSGEHIDKIYFIEEREQPYNDNVRWIVNEFKNIVHYIPKKYVFTPRMNDMGDLNDPDNRYCFRYQYGIEKSDKNYVFITHNDILYTNNIIGEMLKQINGNVGVGSIGQCWNCPCNSAVACDGEKFNYYTPKVKDVEHYITKFPPARGSQFINAIKWEKLMPLPECRLNEFACLLDRKITVSEGYPNSNVYFFGDYTTLDLSTAWFREMVLKGYSFKNYDINKSSNHGYFAKQAGYPTQLEYKKYVESEMNAKKYYNENLK